MGELQRLALIRGGFGGGQTVWQRGWCALAVARFLGAADEALHVAEVVGAMLERGAIELDEVNCPVSIIWQPMQQLRSRLCKREEDAR